MAAAYDRIQSLVIFNEITPEYSLSEDDHIECRFYVDSSLDTRLDKIGLYRIGWTHKQDFIIIKDVHKCSADDFGERKLVFSGEEFSDGMVREGVEYQFCYWHPFGDQKKYQLCGRSQGFRFFTASPKPSIKSPEIQRKASPSAPEMSIHYPVLEMENLDINRTNPKKIYDSNEGLFDDILNQSEDSYYRNSTPKVTPVVKRRSVVYEMEAKDRELSELKERFAQQKRIKDLEIEKLRTTVRLTEEKVTSLEYELQTKVENEDRLEALHNELMDSIKLTETKNCSLEEQLSLRDNDVKQLKRQCSSQERSIEELRHKLTISDSELGLYQSRNLESIELEDNRLQELNQENRQLKDRLEEVLKVSEKLKQNNDRLIKDKRLSDQIKDKTVPELEVMCKDCANYRKAQIKAEQDRTDALLKLRAKEVLIKKYTEIIGNAEGQDRNKSVDQLLTQTRRTVNSSITVYSNEMVEEVQEFCVKQTKEALKRYNDIKSMADSIVYAMDEEFGNCWNCFIGQNFDHNSLLHIFGTYFSFAINDMKIIVYKVNDMADPNQVIRWAKESPNVNTLFKTQFVDNQFEDIVVSTALALIEEDFADYSELSARLTKTLNTNYGPKYGYNWFAVCGESDRFDANLLIFSKKYKSFEFEINLLKLIVIQFDEKITENTNSLFVYKSFANKN